MLQTQTNRNAQTNKRATCKIKKTLISRLGKTLQKRYKIRVLLYYIDCK